MRVHQQNPRTWGRPARYFIERKEALSVGAASLDLTCGSGASSAQRADVVITLASQLVVGEDRPLLSTPSILPSYHAYVLCSHLESQHVCVCVYTAAVQFRLECETLFHSRVSSKLHIHKITMLVVFCQAPFTSLKIQAKIMLQLIYCERKIIFQLKNQIKKYRLRDKRRGLLFSTFA